MIKIDYSGIAPTPKPDKIAAEQVREKLRTHPMNGWVRLPYETEHLRHIIDVAGSVRRASDAVIVAGAGGSSLGARAVIDALGVADVPKFFWCGDNLSGTAMSRLLYALLGYENITVIVISKSGSTLETTVATRFLVPILQERHGDAAREHLIVITEPKQSPLRRFAETLGARTFDIPENVGGRYSVLSPVGLVPIAIAGVDIDELLRGAREQAERGDGDALQFAATRNALYDTGFRTELFASFEPQLERFGAWWRQLFGESEGKQGGGILPATVSYSGDLHSMGQYVQDGRRDLFETVLSFDTAQNDASVPAPVYDDGLPTLAGRGLNEINDLVRRAVVEAHVDGGVPVAQLSVPTLDARGLGAAIYFFETVCAYSCFLRGVDPFDQPGVEAYKSRVKKFLNN